ncbi:MAG: chemotaxis response regulator protein-glutamate methylesterase, partial [Gemmatimonadaceae bacterium]
MRKIRVLVVDDSVVIRRMVSDILSSDPAIEVVGTAANGRIALQKIEQLNPDIVTLDVEMPVMDGLATIPEIRKSWPTLPIVMLSTLTEVGASTTLEALTLGATDYVAKPSNAGSMEVAQQIVRAELLPKVKNLCARAVGTASTDGAVVREKPTSPIVRATSSSRIELVAIGVSTGGPNALGTLMPEFPAEFSVPIVITQHMPPLFTKLLAQRLRNTTKLDVVEAGDGGVLKAGSGWVAPGDNHLVLERRASGVFTKLDHGPAENSCRPAVDVMFRSAVATYGAGVLAVILTGMGQDGLRGAELVKEAGGTVIVQDEATSVVWGMPGHVANAGLADAVLP